MPGSGPGMPLSELPRGAEAALPSRRAAEVDHKLDQRMLNARHHELGDAIAAADGEWFRPEIDEQHLDLAAIVRVNGAGAIQERGAGFQRQAGARAKLRFEPWWQFEREAGGNERAGAWRKLDSCAFGETSDHIEPGGMLGVISRKRQPLAMDQAQHAGGHARAACARRRLRG